MKTDIDASTSQPELDSLTNRFFAAVSFEEGRRPAYDTLYELFIEGGFLVRNSIVPPEISTVSQFIEPRRRSVDGGELTHFTERETGALTEIFGNVAHRFSTYEKQGIRNGMEFSGRGIISIQYIMMEAGWRMSAMAWDDERPGLTFPERYR